MAHCILGSDLPARSSSSRSRTDALLCTLFPLVLLTLLPLVVVPLVKLLPLDPLVTLFPLVPLVILLSLVPLVTLLPLVTILPLVPLVTLFNTPILLPLSLLPLVPILTLVACQRHNLSCHHHQLVREREREMGEETRCGLGSFRPAWLQPLASKQVSLVKSRMWNPHCAYLYPIHQSISFLFCQYYFSMIAQLWHV